MKSIVSTLKLSTILLSTFTFPSLADNHQFYFGAALNHVSLELNNEQQQIEDELNQLGQFATKDANTGYKLNFGYRFAENLAMEFAYGSVDEIGISGEIDHTEFIIGQRLEISGNASALVEISAIELALRGAMPVTEELQLFARGGVSFWQQEARSEVSLVGQVTSIGFYSEETTSESFSEDGEDVFLALGSSFAIDRFQVFIELQSGSYGKQDVNAVVLGSNYLF